MLGGGLPYVKEPVVSLLITVVGVSAGIAYAASP